MSPVFFYENSALHNDRRRLEQVRRLATSGGPPDIGEGRHPTAGACAVGGREFLIAWNIWLETDDLGLAKRIARAVRFSSGGFPGVKALGLPLSSLGLVQVSINSTDFRLTPLDVVFDRVESLAREAGVQVRGCELIGLIPKRSGHSRFAVAEPHRRTHPDPTCGPTGGPARRSAAGPSGPCRCAPRACGGSFRSPSKTSSRSPSTRRSGTSGSPD